MNRAGWVGLFFVGGMVLLFVLAMRVDDEGHLFHKENARKYTTVMRKIGSIGRGGIVRMAGSGVKIGRVDRVELESVRDPKTGKERYEYRIDFSVKDKVKDFKVIIKEDSVVRLAMTTILQGMHLEVTPGSPNAKDLDSDGRLAAAETGDLMETLAGLGKTLGNLGDGGLGRMLLGNQGLEQVNKVLGQVAGDGGLGKWVLGSDAHKHLEPALGELKKTVENLRKGTDVEGEGAVARLLHDPKLGEKFDGIVADLRESLKGVRKFATDIAEGRGTIARLASDEELGKKVDSLLTDATAVVADLRAGESMLGRLISDTEMGDQLKTTIAGIATFSEALSKGEGALPRLVSDPEVYVEIKRLVTQMREAVEDAREQAPISAFTSLLFGAVQ